MKSRYNPVLVAVILLGLCCALWLNWIRYEIENKNDTVEMAMEYENLRKLAALEGLAEDDVMASFRDAGITTLMVFDSTLDRMSKNGVLFASEGSKLREAALLGSSGGIFASIMSDEKLDKNSVYVAEGNDKKSFDETLEDLRLRYGESRVELIGTEPRIVKVSGSTPLVADDKFDEPLGLWQAPLGISTADMRKVAAMGFKIIVRPHNYTVVNKGQIDSVFKRIEGFKDKITAYMPCGNEVLGYPDNIRYTADKMNAFSVPNGLKLVLLEHYTQLQFARIEGLIPLAEAVYCNAIRSYVIDPLEQKRIPVAEALRRWALTDEERNIRINYIRPFFIAKGDKSLMDMNLEYVKNIAQNVKDRGYKIGEVSVFVNPEVNGTVYFPNKIVLIPIIAAAFAGAALYLSMLWSMKTRTQIILWAVAVCAAVSLLLFWRGLMLRQLTALMTAVIFPVLSMSVILDIWDKYEGGKESLCVILFRSIWQLGLAVLLSLIGAAFLSAILTDSRFLLEIDIYRGVKLTFILPVILFALLYIKRYDLLGVAGKDGALLADRIDELLRTAVSFKQLIFFGVLIFMAYYFVGRSGHTGGVPVPAIEIKIRLLLEQIIYARPREKEFMIGHPAFFMAAFAAYRGAPRLWQFILSCGAIIGQGALVETFCHMRTPVIMSLIRALDGYVGGVILGIIAVIIFASAVNLALDYKRRYRGND